jgi:hypothetical protein
MYICSRAPNSSSGLKTLSQTKSTNLRFLATMSHVSPVIIQVSHVEVTQCDPSRIARILEDFVPHLLDRNRNRVQIEVMGYDQRELFDIPEVRKYFTALFELHAGLFYWIDVSSSILVFLGLMLFEPNRVAGRVGLLPRDMQVYHARGFAGLNSFCAVTGASANAANADINAQLHG